MTHVSDGDQPSSAYYAQAPAKAITAGGVRFAYRELGPREEIPVVFFVHLAATLDNWDPRIIDPIARHRHVIAFDQPARAHPAATFPTRSNRPPRMPTRSSPRSATTRSTSSRSRWAG